MERLATDTAPRALTQRRTRLRSREKDGERGGRELAQRGSRRSETPRGERLLAQQAIAQRSDTSKSRPARKGKARIGRFLYRRADARRLCTWADLAARDRCLPEQRWRQNGRRPRRVRLLASDASLVRITSRFRVYVESVDVLGMLNDDGTEARSRKLHSRDIGDAGVYGGIRRRSERRSGAG